MVCFKNHVAENNHIGRLTLKDTEPFSGRGNGINTILFHPVVKCNVSCWDMSPDKHR